MFRRLGVVVLIYNSYYLKGRRKIKSWSPVSQTKQNKTKELWTTMGLDYEHMIKARAHKGGVRIGKTPKTLASICCP
jgi:hypothetical protein